MLDGGSAPWLSYSERSQVRSYLARLGEPDADAWRGILRGRSEVRLVRAHSAAVARLSGQVGVLRAGPGEAVQRGFDLLVLGEPRQEFYVPAGEWGYLASSLGLQPSADGNVVIRHPLMLWPFGDIAALPDAAIAADLLDGPEPRAVRAGQERLNELLRVVAR